MKRYILILFIIGVALSGGPRLQAQEAQDSLAAYMVSAVQNNPKVLSSWRSYQATLEAVCPAGTLGDPELSVNWYPKPMQLVSSKQLATFGLMQMFPWFGSMKAARLEKSWQTQTMYEAYRQQGIDVAFQIEQKWYEILSTQEQIKAIKLNIEYMTQMQQTALYQYTSPNKGKMKGNMSDQLRLETEAISLQEQLETAQTKLTLQKQQLNLLMHRDASSPLTLPDTIILRQMPLLSLDDIEKASPALASIRDEQAALENTVKKQKKSGMPKIGLGATYMLNEKIDNPKMESMNGKDMWMAMFKVTLPIYRRKINASVRQAQMQQSAAEEKYASQLDQLQNQWLTIMERADEQLRKIELLEKQLDLVNRTLTLMQAEYAVEATNVTDILSTDRQQVSLALRLAEAKAQYNTTVAELEKIAALNTEGLSEKQEIKGGC